MKATLACLFGLVQFRLFSLTFGQIINMSNENSNLALSRPAILDDPEYGIHRKIQLKGIALHYVENGNKSQPLMLLLHGFPEFWFSWRHQIKHFAKTHWVVALDERGYGESDKPSEILSYNLNSLESDILQIVQAFGRKDCILVGQDWGGTIAWVVAAKHPEIIQKLIIMNAPHPTAYNEFLKKFPVEILRSWYFGLFQIPILPEGIISKIFGGKIFKTIFEKSSTREEIEAYEYTYQNSDSWTPPINYYRNIFSGEYSATFPRIQVPTLIIWGKNDLVLDIGLPEATRPFVDDLKIEFVSDGGHFVQSDKPDVVNRLIETFIS